MQFFRDPQNGQYYALDDDVRATGPDGALTFVTAGGVTLAVLPARLVRSDPPLPPSPELPSVDAILAEKRAGGIAVTFNSAPALSATYALDDVTLGEIGSVARDAAAGLGLPGDAEMFAYPDITSTPHPFTAPLLIALYKAMRNLMLALKTQANIARQGGTPEWPAQSITLD